MKRLRDLLYKEKFLDDFDIRNDKSLFSIFYNLLITHKGTRPIDIGAERKIEKMFNDACYICTLALHTERPEMKIGEFRELCYNNDTVLCMVYFLLEKTLPSLPTFERILPTLDQYLRQCEQWDVYQEFVKSCSFNCCTQEKFEFFEIKKITMQEIDNIDWNWITHDYQEDKIRQLVTLWNDPNPRNIIIDRIKQEVERHIFNDEEYLPF